MKTWVSFRIERTKIGIINYNKKTTAGKTPAVVFTLIYCMFESVFVILFCEHKDCQ